MGSNNSKRPVAAASPVRGKAKDKDEATEWRRKDAFKDLPREGKEAFFRFLCDGGVYPGEDKDICDVEPKATGMNSMSRKYQFWLQCEQLELFSKFFNDYVTDEDMRFPEVDECFVRSRTSEDNSIDDFLLRKKTDAKNTECFVTELQTEIKPKLDTYFGKFKEDLRKQFGD